MARSLSFVLTVDVCLRSPVLVAQGGALPSACLWIAIGELLLAILLLVLAAAMSLHYHLQLLGEARHLSRLGLPTEVRELLRKCE